MEGTMHFLCLGSAHWELTEPLTEQTWAYESPRGGGESVTKCPQESTLGDFKPPEMGGLLKQPPVIDIKGAWRKGSGGRGSPWFLPQGTTTPCGTILEGCRLYHGTLTDGSFAGWKGQCSSHSPPGLAVSPCPASWASLVTTSGTCLSVYRSCGTWKARPESTACQHQPET